MTRVGSAWFWPGLGLSWIVAVSATTGCHRRPQPDPQERARISEWQLMVSAARSPSALDQLRTRAKSGMLEAESALGQALCEQTDQALAAEGRSWLERAATDNDARALFTLGKLELAGSHGFARNYAGAREHLLKAAAQHEPRADYYLGIMARNGYGAPADPAASVKYLNVAAAGGIPQAMFLLANAFRDGTGVARDQRRALQLYEQAAEKDHPESIQALAMAYQNGELGLARDPGRFESELAELADAQKHAPPLP